MAKRKPPEQEGDNMKTLAVLAKVKQNVHAGEEYDSILIVENIPTTETIDRWGETLMREIRMLFQKDKSTGDEGKVVVTLDGPSPYNAILLNLQVILKAEEGITIELPYLSPDFFKTDDPETNELLARIGEKG
jgi:hypothetical protein